MIKIVVAAILAVTLAGGVFLFNRLVRLRNMLRASWSDIDVMLKKRHDLVPNLVEVVKGYAGHEKGTLSQVTDARTKAMRAEGPADKAREENTFTETLKSLFALVEGYPDLKADAGFLEMQKQLVEIENGIEYAVRAREVLRTLLSGGAGSDRCILFLTRGALPASGNSSPSAPLSFFSFSSQEARKPGRNTSPSSRSAPTSPSTRIPRLP
jgi:LemA protein